MDVETCYDSEWRCGNGRCIDARKRCDGYNDCKDDNEELWRLNSDEDNCRSVNSQSDSDGPQRVSSNDVIAVVVGCSTFIFFICIILALCYIRAKRKVHRPPAGEVLSAQNSQQNNPPSAQGTEVNRPLVAPALLNTSPSAPAYVQQQSSLPSGQFAPSSYMASAQDTHQNNPLSAQRTQENRPQFSPALLNTTPSVPPIEQFDPSRYTTLQPYRNQSGAATFSCPPPSYEDVMGVSKQ